MSYHMHNYREEVWTVVSGKGKVVIDEEKKIVYAGDVIKIPKGCKHSIEAIENLDLIEVQLGNEITVDDKIKF